MGEIPVTLYGMALEMDLNQDAREQLDDELHKSALKRYN
jgi:hypothetical protein